MTTLSGQEGKDEPLKEKNIRSLGGRRGRWTKTGGKVAAHKRINLAINIISMRVMTCLPSLSKPFPLLTQGLCFLFCLKRNCSFLLRFIPALCCRLSFQNLLQISRLLPLFIFMDSFSLSGFPSFPFLVPSPKLPGNSPSASSLPPHHLPSTQYSPASAQFLNGDCSKTTSDSQLPV